MNIESEADRRREIDRHLRMESTRPQFMSDFMQFLSVEHWLATLNSRVNDESMSSEVRTINRSVLSILVKTFPFFDEGAVVVVQTSNSSLDLMSDGHYDSGSSGGYHIRRTATLLGRVTEIVSYRRATDRNDFLERVNAWFSSTVHFDISAATEQVVTVSIVGPHC